MLHSLGTYTYGDPAHLHAVTAVSNGSSSYTAAYNAFGALTCRAPTSAATCAEPVGSRTGAGLGYNDEGQVNGWQNTLAGTPTTTENAAYDGEGHRVASNVVSNGVTTSTTDYLAGGLEEVTTAGSTTTLTKYESVPGVCSVVIVGSGPSETISYVTTDGLGSVSEALDGNGTVTAQQLFGPYGTGRFSLGAMPTAKGYTGQYADPATTGLVYYGARYYDPLVGQFTSADTDAKGGLNRYAYVGGNPETATDPTGHFRCDDSGCKRGGGNGGAGGCTFDCKGSPSGGCRSDCGGKGHRGGNGCSSDCTHISRLINQGGSGDVCLDPGCATQHPPVSFDTCTSDQVCLYGDDPTSLFSLIANDLQGESPTWITAVGDKGLKWLISALGDIEAAGDKILENLESTADKVGLFAGIFLGAGPTLVAGAYSLDLWIDQQQFDHMLDNVIERLKGLDFAYNHGQAAWVQNARFMVQSHYSGCLECVPAGFQDAWVSVQTWILDPPASSA